MENVFERVEDCAAEHDIRMVTSVCMPKESYSYVAMIDSIKGLSQELTNFSKKIIGSDPRFYLLRPRLRSALLTILCHSF